MEKIITALQERKKTPTRLTKNSKLFKTIIKAIQDKKGDEVVSLDGVRVLDRPDAPLGRVEVKGGPPVAGGEGLRRTDAAGGGDILIDLPVVKNAINAQELILLAKTEPLLFLPWAVKRNMPVKLRDSIRANLLEQMLREAEALSEPTAEAVGDAE